jgi:mRNA-degrading endonuclease HigB of HigAB toxin-antitoxin module
VVIGSNKYRIVARVDYVRQTVKIAAIMDHAEYDKQQWKNHF